MDKFLESTMPSLNWDDLEIVEDFPSKMQCNSESASEENQETKIITKLLLKLYRRAAEERFRRNESTFEDQAA